MMLSLFVGCKTIPSYNDVIPVHDSLSIVSVKLNEKRVVNVWTPSQYKTGSGTFPVLYMLDGGIHEIFHI
jgi:predicted alpha/beta superfamily hydrolase